MEDQKIRVKAMCLFVNDGKILVAKGTAKTTNESFYRVIGGSLNFQEKSGDGIRREIREELGCEIENLKLLKIVENIFTFDNKPGHNICFLYGGELSNKELYKQDKILVKEPYEEFYAVWVSVSEILNGDIPLYPELDYSEFAK